MKQVIILRGIPGSGKSTFARILLQEHQEYCERVKVICRDWIRRVYCYKKLNNTKGDWNQEDIENAYQESLINTNENIVINERFWQMIKIALFQDDIDTLIIDATFTKKEDLIKISKILVAGKFTSIIYEMQNYYGSKHNVPPDKMKIYREDLIKNREIAQAIADEYEYVS